MNKGDGEQIFARGSIQDKEESIAICLGEQLARLAVK